MVSDELGSGALFLSMVCGDSMFSALFIEMCFRDFRRKFCDSFMWHDRGEHVKRHQ